MVCRSMLPATAALLAMLVPVLAQAADQPVASASIPPPAMPPAPYVVPSHPTPPPAIPRIGTAKPAVPTVPKKLGSAEQVRHARQALQHAWRHLRHESHHIVVHIDKSPPAPSSPPRRRYYAGDVPSADWEAAPPPGWYGGYYPGPWRRDAPW